MGLLPEAVDSSPGGVTATGSRTGRATESNDGDATDAVLEAQLERPSVQRDTTGREVT